MLALRLTRDYFRELFSVTTEAWDRFWFTPRDAATLGLLRILTGSLLVYTLLIWSLDLNAFFGPTPWLDLAATAARQADSYHWSHWWLIQSPGLMWGTHLLTIGFAICFTLGVWTRTTSILAWLCFISYAQRVQDALYGLDQILSLLLFYLMIGPSGAVYSVDAWWKRRRQQSVTNSGSPAAPQQKQVSEQFVSANLATRLIQLHLCVVYLFAGLSKLQGPAWWNGTAFWGALANQEYQTLDLTWLVHYPLLVNVLTHATVIWEISYIALIWPRLTRPLMIALAVPVHLGIGLAMGMPTFGAVMLVANLSFVSPALVRQFLPKW